MSEKQKQPEVYNVIYNISQDIVATGFRSGETSDYDLITQIYCLVCLKEFLKSLNIWQSYRKES